MPVTESLPVTRIGRNWRIAITVAVVLAAVGGAVAAASIDWSPGAHANDPPALAPPVAGSPLAAPEPTISGTRGRSSPAARRSGPSPSAPVPASASALPVSVGMVDVRAVAENPNVLAVSGLFDRYFSGINAKQYEQVVTLFDPSGFFNPNDSAQVKTFTEGVSTSTDSQVVLRSITDSAAAEGDLDVRLTLQSHQAAGFGPSGSPDETCTNWDITYQLRPAGGGYRILRPRSVAHVPC